MIELNISSTEQNFYQGPATRVLVPGMNGGFEIRSDHCPVLSLLTTGVISADIPDGEPFVLYVESGLIEVIDNKVSILADMAFLARELAEETLLKEQKEFRDNLTAKQETINYNALLKQLSETNAQLLAIKRLRSNKKAK